jgi:glutathione-regulated potassium-efflux system ancillary protein KefC
MGNVWVLASVWVGLVLIATILAIWFKISTALTEIVVGTMETAEKGIRLPVGN